MPLLCGSSGAADGGVASVAVDGGCLRLCSLETGMLLMLALFL